MDTEKASEQQQLSTSVKRKQQTIDRKADSYQEAYKGFSFQPVASTGRPGSPHRYFAESFRVCREENDGDSAAASAVTINPRIHKNANGVLVVTVDDKNGHLLQDVSSVEIIVPEAPNESQQAKRKKQSKMLKGKSVLNVVRPSDTLALLKCGSGGDGGGDRSLALCCGVWGSVLEVNANLTPELLRDDPLLNGFVAIILPTGPFPPDCKDEIGSALADVGDDDEGENKSVD